MSTPPFNNNNNSNSSANNATNTNSFIPSIKIEASSGHNNNLNPNMANNLIAGIKIENPLQELINLFECPVCFDYALPPILQCQSGHIVCSNCRPKLTCCPSCRSPLTNIRNLSMEKLANSVQFPCKYISNGCKEMMHHEKKHEHEDACELRPYNCPCPGASCKWQGALDQVMQLNCR